MDELSYQIRRVAPSEGLYGVAWQTYSTSRKGLPVWESACFNSLDVFIEKLRAYPSALVVKNLYFTHATFKAPDLTRPRNPPRLDRRIGNFLATRTLVIDGDVKPGAFRYDRRMQADHFVDARRDRAQAVLHRHDERAARSVTPCRDIGHARLPDYDAPAVRWRIGRRWPAISSRL